MIKSRIKTYFGTLWFVIENNDPEKDDIIAIEFENYYKLCPRKFCLLGWDWNKGISFKIVIANFGITIF